ncbi:unnamed protein product [Ambrosiozyma monospora]|uniref:Unnamed protein product n=1 Tax=Ambrosiozyma monospora TaxID=43982 RepID=A0ACB5SZJ0_AMBMO|nr:unnamed protein product [Ambrosiozyma monospora]
MGEMFHTEFINSFMETFDQHLQQRNHNPSDPDVDTGLDSSHDLERSTVSSPENSFTHSHTASSIATSSADSPTKFKKIKFLGLSSNPESKKTYIISTNDIPDSFDQSIFLKEGEDKETALKSPNYVKKLLQKVPAYVSPDLPPGLISRCNDLVRLVFESTGVKFVFRLNQFLLFWYFFRHHAIKDRRKRHKVLENGAVHCINFKCPQFDRDQIKTVEEMPVGLGDENEDDGDDDDDDEEDERKSYSQANDNNSHQSSTSIEASSLGIIRPGLAGVSMKPNKSNVSVELGESQIKDESDPTYSPTAPFQQQQHSFDRTPQQQLFSFGYPQAGGYSQQGFQQLPASLSSSLSPLQLPIPQFSPQDSLQQFQLLTQQQLQSDSTQSQQQQLQQNSFTIPTQQSSSAITRIPSATLSTPTTTSSPILTTANPMNTIANLQQQQQIQHQQQQARMKLKKVYKYRHNPLKSCPVRYAIIFDFANKSVTITKKGEYENHKDHTLEANLTKNLSKAYIRKKLSGYREELHCIAREFSKEMDEASLALKSLDQEDVLAVRGYFSRHFKRCREFQERLAKTT